MFGTVLSERPQQGDIFQKLQFKYIDESGDTISLTFPFWVIITQECDLEHDFKAAAGLYSSQDKCLQTIVACPAFPKELLKDGVHMQNIPLKMEVWGGDNWKKILANRDSRFHTIPLNELPELPDLVLVLDFKRLFSFPRSYIYNQLNHRVATLDTPYREQLCQRLTNFSSRIALPDDLDS